MVMNTANYSLIVTAMEQQHTQEEILQTLRSEIPYLRNRYGVERIAVYGSFAKGVQTKESDVDILVKLKEPLGLDFVDLAYYLEDVLDREVDLATFDRFEECRNEPRYQHIAVDVERTLVDVEEARPGFPT